MLGSKPVRKCVRKIRELQGCSMSQIDPENMKETISALLDNEADDYRRPGNAIA